MKNLVLSYETLANKTIKLNQSYLDLLKLYNELNLDPALLAELEKNGNSPITVVESMRKDQQVLEHKLIELTTLISSAQFHFPKPPEASELKTLAHDCPILQNFICSIDLEDLKQMFVQLNPA